MIKTGKVIALPRHGSYAFVDSSKAAAGCRPTLYIVHDSWIII